MNIQIKVLLLIAIMLTNTLIVATAVPEDKQSVLIGFNGKPDAALVRGHGGNVNHQYEIIDAIAAELPQAAIEKLRSNKKIKYIELDGIAYTTAQSTPWGISKIEADKVWVSPYNNKGIGIKVAILDTGIRYNHPDLMPVTGVNFVGTGNDGKTASSYWNDKFGHGTHVAGIVAARDNGIGVVGVAPEADLIAVKVLNDWGSGSFSDIIQGIEWVTNNGQRRADIISMSFGSSTFSQSMSDAVNRSKNAGVVLIAASGNSGDGNASTDNVGYPAKYDSVIAVAATNSTDVIAYFSSDGSAVDVAAPGVGIISTVPTGGCFWLVNVCDPSGYRSLDGTSMATPHVSGTVALMLKAGITPAQVQAKLQNTTVDLGTPGFDVFYGWGRINASAAVS